MEQILVVLSDDADASAISNAVDNSSGSLHAYLAPTVLLVDGGESTRDALNQVGGVLATLSEDEAKTVVASTDLMQIDIAEMATLLGKTLGTNTSFDEPVVLAVSGWMHGWSEKYANQKSDRFRDGEPWDMDGGCLPSDAPLAEV